MPDWIITYAILRSVEVYSDNINEAVDIAKRGKRKDEEIVRIELEKGTR